MGNTNEKTAEQAAMFANRLQKRFRHLKKWAQRTGAGVFRLYDRDIPEIPVVLDFYGDSASGGASGGAFSGAAALAGALYKRPYEKDDAEEERWLLAMKESAALALEIEPERIFLKLRRRQRGQAQYEKMGNERFTLNVNEGGLSFKVNLSDYLDCGLFPDRRLLRALVRGKSAGKRVLNLFCYTGSFSVYAAAGGAATTTSVDLSNTYLSWARENFSLNGFHARLVSGQGDYSAQAHTLVRADALVFLETAGTQKWDIIVLDPPAFSNSKKMSGSLDLRRDRTALINNCLNLLAPGGELFFSVNTQRRTGDLQKELAQHRAGVQVKELGNEVIDEDFRGRKTPSSYIITLR